MYWWSLTLGHWRSNGPNTWQYNLEVPLGTWEIWETQFWILDKKEGWNIYIKHTHTYYSLCMCMYIHIHKLSIFMPIFDKLVYTISIDLINTPWCDVSEIGKGLNIIERVFHFRTMIGFTLWLLLYIMNHTENSKCISL